jgi:Flp pilus assembly protein TadD/uncharacterized protein (AIM24 family)
VLRTPARVEEVEGQDEEFLHHLARGGDLLARDSEAAVVALERARELRPKDPKVLGLLGQALYKAGRFDAAIDAYQRLVDESPVEAAARVNLGLANLKAKRLPQAIRQLETALELQPDHKRALGYLGLAWLESGQPRRARDWFQRAGSEQMVIRCDDLVARAAEAAALVEGAGPDLPEAAGGEPVVADAGPLVLDAAAPEERVTSQPSLILDEGATDLGEPRAVPELVLAREVPFTVERGLLTVTVGRDVLARADGLVAVRGSVRLRPEMKRFRGQPTDKPFGHGRKRMLRASGLGVLVYQPGARRLARVDLTDEPGYFREDAVLAFDAEIAFENGRVASRLGTDLDLVHLRGRGSLLLATASEVVAVAVSPGAPLRLPAGALVGWIGTLTPQFGALVEGLGREAGGEGEPLTVELSGQGRVLLEGAVT